MLPLLAKNSDLKNLMFVRRLLMFKPPDTRENSQPEDAQPSPMPAASGDSGAVSSSDDHTYYDLYTLPATPAAQPPPGNDASHVSSSDDHTYYDLYTLPPTPAMRPPAGVEVSEVRPEVQDQPYDLSTLAVVPAVRSPLNGNSGSIAALGTGHQAHKKKIVVRSIRRRATASFKAHPMLLLLLVATLLPSIVIIIGCVNTYVIYNQAMSGIQHLEDAQSHLKGNPSGGIAQYLNVNTLRLAQQDVTAAHSDFAQLSAELDNGAMVSFAGGLFPQQITSVRQLAHIGVDATQAMQQVLVSGIKLAPSIAPGLSTLGSQNNAGPLKPLINQAGLDEIAADITYVLPLVQDMNQRAQLVSLDSLPLNASQRSTFSAALQFLPIVETSLTEVHSNINLLGWLLGVGGARTFLVEPMDRAELRATGGFTGQFGELNINGGNVGPLQLKNIGAYEEDHSLLPGGSPPIDSVMYNTKINGHQAPAPFNAWWPVGNFGMRDANLSADFPTSAKLIMHAYQYEFGTPLDGLIVFTPYLIEDVLRIIGPIHIPLYNETITAQNLEARLHYYQLDNNGIYREQVLEHIQNSELARKAFTQRVTSTLITTIQHSSTATILQIVKLVGSEMKEKNLQIYMNNPQVEDLIAKYGSTDQMDLSTTHDGVYIVQSNLSANKASQYVTTAVKDTITVDASGTATHQMQMTLNYQQQGSVDGPDTYNDYIRVYVPPDSHLNSGNGFSQLGQTYCGDASVGYPSCAQDVYGNGTLMCPANMQVGDATGYLSNMGPDSNVLYRVGGPTNTTTDQAGRAMYAGWAIIPKDCTLKISLSWSVPAPTGGQHPYSLLFQPQASVQPQLDLTIQAQAGSCGSRNANLQYTGISNGEDETFSLAQNSSGCTLQRKLE
jgi:hypothetical protein